MRTPAEYHTSVADGDLASAAEWAFARVFRRDLGPPGFALITLSGNPQGEGLRRQMLALQESLDALHRQRAGGPLERLSFVQFDQQRSTKFHLDGGPSESALMLGYEPSAVASELFIADYSRAASEMGISPSEYLDAHNPMFAVGEEILAAHITPITAFDPSRTQVLIVNNSSADEARKSQGRKSQGVMHKAVIRRPMPDEARIVHSMMLRIGSEGACLPRGADGANSHRLD